MRVKVSSVLNCSPEKAWDLVTRAQTLIEIMKPLVTVTPTSLPAPGVEWKQGETHTIDCLVFGLFPLSSRKIFFETIDREKRFIQTREQDPMIKTWDHQMTFMALGDNQTRYTDDLEIKAGGLTLVVCLWAKFFYWFRQRKLKTLTG